MWSGTTDAEIVREYGHRLIDRITEYLEGIAELPLSPSPEQMHEVADHLAGPLPRKGRDADEVWAEFWEVIARRSIHLRNPLYMGHQVAPPLPHAALAELVIGLFNQSVAVWEMSPTGTPVERVVIGWMLELLGYPEGADGTFVSGGSAANLTGLLAARAHLFPELWEKGVGATPGADRAVIFAAEHSHYSMERAVGILGLGSDAIYPVPMVGGKMDPGSLQRAIEEARAGGHVPLAIVATAGSTPTGRIDDLEAIAEIAEGEGIWLHVDGAHGASLLVSDELRERVRGIERADSVSWDPHKMMFMPISLGAIFVRDQRHLDNAFRQSAPYLFHGDAEEIRSPDIGQRTLQCSRRLDALKLWISIEHYGLEYFAELLERTVENANLLYEKLDAAPDFEALHQPETNILCFRHLPEALVGADPELIDTYQRELRAAYNAHGRGWITTTRLDGRQVLRVTLMNPGTRPEHLDELLIGLRRVGTEIEEGVLELAPAPR